MHTDKYFIQPIGTHCTGKSRVVSSIALSYGIKFEKTKLINQTKDDTCMVLGRYTKRPNHNFTGGFDAVSISTPERRERIKKLWDSEYKIVMVEGFMLSYYTSFLSWYKTLQSTRKVIIIYLDPSLDFIKDRLVRRSGGKQWTKKRENHVIGKMNVCKKSLESIKDDDFYFTKVFINETDNDIYDILKFVEEETKIKMEKYRIEEDINTLDDWK